MSVNFDIGAALRVAREVERLPGAIERMKERAKGTLKRRLQAQAARVLPARFNVKPAVIRPRLSVGTEGRDVVTLTGSGRALPAHVFGGRYGGRASPGASWQVLVGGEGRVRPGTFVRKNDPEKKIMVRVPSRRDIGQRVQRLPIKGVYGPSVGSMLLSDQVGSGLAEFGAAILAVEVARLRAVELRGL